MDSRRIVEQILVFLTKYSIYVVSFLLNTLTSLDRIVNPDQYVAIDNGQSEPTSRDDATQTEDDNYVEFTNIPCYPIQHKAKISCSLKSLVGNKSRSDVTFCINNEYVAAHRLILASRSDVFDTMLFRFNNVCDEIVYITDIAMDTFRLVLSYIYTDDININNENVIEILYAAHKYNLTFLEERCEHYIVHHKTHGNVLATINLLYQFSAFESIKAKLFKYVCDNFYDHFLQANCFTAIDSIDLMKHLMEKLVAIDHKSDNGRFEFDLFNMLIHWAKYKTKEQHVVDLKWDVIRTCLDGVEQLINFENMNAELLNKCVATNPGFFTKDEICRFFTRENSQSEQKYQRNNVHNALEVCQEGEGFVIFRANGKHINQQLKSILPTESFMHKNAIVDELEL